MRRLLGLFLVVLLLGAPAANALTIHDVTELAKAGVGDQVLLALIEMDPRVYTIDAETVKSLETAGVSEPVIVALIRSGRTPVADDTAAPPPEATEPSAQPAPQVVVIDHRDSAREVPVPVAVPVYIPVVTAPLQRVSTTITTEDGSAVRVKVPLSPNCTKAEPIYWGNGGKRRAGTWEPPVQIICR